MLLKVAVTIFLINFLIDESVSEYKVIPRRFQQEKQLNFDYGSPLFEKDDLISNMEPEFGERNAKLYPRPMLSENDVRLNEIPVVVDDGLVMKPRLISLPGVGNVRGRPSEIIYYDDKSRCPAGQLPDRRGICRTVW